MKRWLAIACGIYGLELLSHLPYLRLPYYWDEAGYFVPAALDFYRRSLLISSSTLANGHPPLLSVWLSLAWRIFGFAPLVTRAAMLVFSAALVTGAAKLAQIICGNRAAISSGLLVFAAPLVFAQGPLAQLDLLAAALIVWALVCYFKSYSGAYAVLAAAACLTKETALLLPVTLAAIEVSSMISKRASLKRLALRLWPHAVPLVVLAGWFFYYHHHTGYWMGNSEFLTYNVRTTLSLPRIGIALLIRLWHVFGYNGTVLLTVMAIAALWLRRRKLDLIKGRSLDSAMPGLKPAHHLALSGTTEVGAPSPNHDFAARPEDAPNSSEQLKVVQVYRGRLTAVALIVLAYIVFHAVIGGAVLARYLLPALALYLVWVAGVLSRVRGWPLVIGFAAAWLTVNWFWYPPYPFTYEDNLAWTDFVRLHVWAAQRLSAANVAGRVLTAWPATDELHTPDLGYVRQSIPVEPIENFTPAAITARPSQYSGALIYSREYQPRFNWTARTGFWERWKQGFFQHHEPLTEEQLLTILDVSTEFRRELHGQWIDFGEKRFTAEGAKKK